VLIAWVIIFVTAKGLKLQKYGVEIKPYSLVYKNKQINSVLIKILSRTKRGIRVFADVSVILGFIMMGYAFYFLLNNISNFFVAQNEFQELTVLIPGVTLTSAPKTIANITSAKTLIPLLVLLRILMRTELTCLFL